MCPDIGQLQLPPFWEIPQKHLDDSAAAKGTPCLECHTLGDIAITGIRRIHVSVLVLSTVQV